MINWMQKHKKSLIPTIWISTIAFVGAGFVGWGAYDMNANRAGSIAKVGQISVTNQELNTKYSELYNRLYSMSDGRFTREQADQMRLDEIAANELIKEAYFLNFANDLGLRATEKDVAQFVVNAPAFQENGVFNQTLYDNSVKNSGLTKKEFERNLQKAITLEKLSDAIKVVPNMDIVEAITASGLVQDSVQAQMIYADDNVSFSDDELKKFWEGEKNHYMSEKKYTLNTYFMPTKTAEASDAELEKFYNENRSAYRGSDDKVLDFAAAKDSVIKDFSVDQAKKTALKKYLEIKKGEADTNETIIATPSTFPVGELGEAKVGEILKPFAYNDGNLIVKIASIDEPKPLSFEEAKELAAADYRVVRASEVLNENAQNALKDFKGTQFGKFTLNSQNTTSLRDDEFYKFISEMFSKPAKEGVVLFDDKALVYKITEQSLGDDTSINENKSMVAQRIDGMINSNLQGDLLKLLEKRYKLERYYKGRDSE
ncbi:peptidylprolyl isomerase [Campylobacter sp. JMF_08 NE1]|uniref:peptidylprolyl isomerase n=1 Tax=Campylobacter sp. JMF_08 NE1 TaxID=2983821 RepID=UPI0022E9A54C|nr:peptidylprolyl isomerase [Campylobacter sp. JMF_08 NE1]MDA3047682.1 peptidylprolyl isomerase [Campylobacter sp. JMF_08 NE1]